MQVSGGWRQRVLGSALGAARQASVLENSRGILVKPQGLRERLAARMAAGPQATGGMFGHRGTHGGGWEQLDRMAAMAQTPPAMRVTVNVPREGVATMQELAAHQRVALAPGTAHAPAVAAAPAAQATDTAGLALRLPDLPG